MQRQLVFLALVALSCVFGSSVTDCGGSSDVAHISGFSISPDTIPIPGDVTLSGTVTISQDLPAPVKVEVTLQKKEPIIGYVNIPCVENFGSCTYDDICSLVEVSEFFQQAVGITVCPIPAGTYSISNQKISIPKIDVGISLSGDYKLKVVSSHNGVEAGCVDAQFSIQQS